MILPLFVQIIGLEFLNCFFILFSNDAGELHVIPLKRSKKKYKWGTEAQNPHPYRHRHATHTMDNDPTQKPRLAQEPSPTNLAHRKLNAELPARHHRLRQTTETLGLIPSNTQSFLCISQATKINKDRPFFSLTEN